MSIVIDANLVIALLLPLPYSEQVATKITAWKRAGIDLVAPLLLEYEAASALRKAVTTGGLDNSTAVRALHKIEDLHIQYFPPAVKLHERALVWAERIDHRVAYDAQYLALAEHLQAELWTADRRLVNSTRQAGIAWVHWIGE